MKICVYGAGAVGGLIAARLARSGNDVSVVARGANLDAIRRHGMRIRTRATGAVDSIPIRAESEPAALGPQDYVIVAVKAQSLTDISAKIHSLYASETTVVSAMK